MPASALLVAAALTPGAAAGESTLDAAMQAEVEAQRRAVASQARLHALAEETTDLATRYRAVITEIEQLRGYAERLETALRDQSREIESLERQLREVEVTEREIEPLLARMTASLAELADLPGPRVRVDMHATVKGLQAGLADSGIGLAEQYRRVMHAYLDELRRGRQLTQETTELSVDGSPRLVNLIQAGSLASLYVSLDGREAAAWHPPTRTWQPLPEAVDDHLADLVAVSSGTGPPELVLLPVSATAARPANTP